QTVSPHFFFYNPSFIKSANQPLLKRSPKQDFLVAHPTNMSILLTPHPLEDLVLVHDLESNQMPRQGNPAIDPLAQFIPDLLPSSSLSSNKFNAAALHVSSIAGDQYEELAEITNTLVPLTACPRTTPVSASGRIRDIRTYFIPPKVSDHATVNMPSRASRSRAGVHSHLGVSTVVIDLTADGPITSIDQPIVEGPLEQPQTITYVEIPFIGDSQEKPRHAAGTDLTSADISSRSPRCSDLIKNTIHKTSNIGPRTNFNGAKRQGLASPFIASARRPPVQNEVGDLAATLTSAFYQNAASQRNTAPQGQMLVSALASAFANNAVAKTPYIGEDESDGPSSLSDSGSEVAPEPGLSEHPRRGRHGRVITPITQIPSPVKRLRPQRAPKDVYAAPSEQTLHEQLDTESPSLQLPVGVSIAPENESEYMDTDDGVLLDYDSSEEVEEERTKRRKLETALAPKVLGNNLRFLQVQRRRSSHRKHPASSALRRDIPQVRSSMAYIQRVEEYCGEPALDYIWCGRQAWASNWKPKQYQISAEEFYSASTPPSDSHDSEIQEEEEADESQEETLNGVISPHLTKHSYPEGNTAPQKRVKFVDDAQLKTPLTTAGPRPENHTQFDAVRCGELLQKLVKGKVQMAEQELRELLLFFGNPSFEQIIRQSRNGDRLGADSQQQAHNSILISLQYIAQSAAGTLGIPEMYEGTLKWESRKLLTA
ncbi:hypothetical protein GYMLUDRAFT_581079, partial [Collybiopsis luxurians FD-317 M1]